MKFVVVFLLILLPSLGYSQELMMVRDTVNKFEVGVPIGWQYGVPQNHKVDLIAYRPKVNEQDIPESFNINIVSTEQTDLDVTYVDFKSSIETVKNFKVLEESEKEINGRRYKVLLESHANQYTGVPMYNYVFITNNNGKALILTTVSANKDFNTYRALFDRIALSLKY